MRSANLLLACMIFFCVLVCSACSKSITSLPQTQPVVTELLQDDTAESDSILEIHFLDVGQGDCALVLLEDHAMLIDGGSASASRLVYSYLKNRSIEHLDYVIATHPDADHIGGLSGALNYAQVDRVLCSTEKGEGREFESFLKYVQKQDLSIEVPYTGQVLPFGNAQVTILGTGDCSWSDNNGSIVLRIEYGSTAFLFTGDAEAEKELALIQSGLELKSDVLKIAHHGSGSSSTQDFLSAVSAQYGVISVGKDNTYGHPHSSVLDRLQKTGMTVLRTDLQGDIVCRSDGTYVTVQTEKNENLGEDRLPSQPPAGTDYILNTNSRKFHLPDCSGAAKIGIRNRAEYTGARESLLAEGYVPCGICNP